MWRRLIWMLVGCAAAYIVMLMLVTPTPALGPPARERDILERFLPG